MLRAHISPWLKSHRVFFEIPQIIPRDSKLLMKINKKHSPVLVVASTTMVQDDNLGAGGWCLGGLKNGLTHKNCDLTWFNPQKIGFYMV